MARAMEFGPDAKTLQELMKTDKEAAFSVSQAMVAKWREAFERLAERRKQEGGN